MDQVRERREQTRECEKNEKKNERCQGPAKMKEPLEPGAPEKSARTQAARDEGRRFGTVLRTLDARLPPFVTLFLFFFF
jgi:hypothetical protein